jgi:Coenzyme PQQ synthesis protein D (PqqD)
MSSSATPQSSSLLAARVRLPQHVVYRCFPSETVVLNLQTGKYHGLNPSAGLMLEALEKSETVLAAAEVAAKDYDQPQQSIEQDMCDLCSALLSRGLIEVDGNGAV